MASLVDLYSYLALDVSSDPLYCVLEKDNDNVLIDDVLEDVGGCDDLEDVADNVGAELDGVLILRHFCKVVGPDLQTIHCCRGAMVALPHHHNLEVCDDPEEVVAVEP